MNELKQNLKFLREDGNEYLANLFICNNIGNIDLKDPKLILSNQEYHKYINYPSQNSRDNFLLGRYSAKKALIGLCDIINPCDINISNGVFGQPIINHKNINNIQISVAHSNNISASIAFEESHPMAIDIEPINKNKLTDIETQLTSNELALFANIDVSAELFGFILWTAKESLSKILKTGLTIPVTILEINSIKKIGENEFVCTYSNFLQYQAVSYANKDFIYSLTFPKNSKITVL